MADQQGFLLVRGFEKRIVSICILEKINVILLMQTAAVYPHIMQAEKYYFKLCRTKNPSEFSYLNKLVDSY